MNLLTTHDHPYFVDNYIFHYIIDAGIVFLCMCEDASTKKRIAFRFLEEMKKEWRQRYSEVRLLFRKFISLSYIYRFISPSVHLSVR